MWIESIRPDPVFKSLGSIIYSILSATVPLDSSWIPAFHIYLFFYPGYNKIHFTSSVRDIICVLNENHCVFRTFLFFFVMLYAPCVEQTYPSAIESILLEHYATLNRC